MTFNFVNDVSVASKSNRQKSWKVNKNFVAVVKVSDENSRIRKSEVRILGSGSGFGSFHHKARVRKTFDFFITYH
jgi:hypothetical protein